MKKKEQTKEQEKEREKEKKKVVHYMNKVPEQVKQILVLMKKEKETVPG